MYPNIKINIILLCWHPRRNLMWNSTTKLAEITPCGNIIYLRRSSPRSLMGDSCWRQRKLSLERRSTDCTKKYSQIPLTTWYGGCEWGWDTRGEISPLNRFLTQLVGVIIPISISIPLTNSPRLPRLYTRRCRRCVD